MYSEKELQDTLKTKIFGRKLYIYDNIESTNILAKRVASLGAVEGTVVITDLQTAGRGRMGRVWVGDPASNLLLSIVIRPKIDNIKMGLLPFFTAVGVAFTIEALTGLQCECKWPNDLLLNGRKCCGILLESSFLGSRLEYAVIGIGLNVNQEHFGEELDHKATSLFNECGKRIEVKDVFKQLMQSLESLYSDVQNGYFNTTIREWKSRTKMIGKEITIVENNEEISGTAIDIANDGGLIVDTPEGGRIFYAADVTIKKW
jgi:BirA family transcriptional regulator, biotin operon repressor / biotin---[acetyl-CoA-carboxylase] ligase